MYQISGVNAESSIRLELIGPSSGLLLYYIMLAATRPTNAGRALGFKESKIQGL